MNQGVVGNHEGFGKFSFYCRYYCNWIFYDGGARMKKDVT